jgi:hypothetical protein
MMKKPLRRDLSCSQQPRMREIRNLLTNIFLLCCLVSLVSFHPLFYNPWELLACVHEKKHSRLSTMRDDEDEQQKKKKDSRICVLISSSIKFVS